MIYVTGDTHGRIDTDKVEVARFPDSEKLTKDDYLIICGDFGGIFYGGERDESTLNYWENKPYTVLFIDGNHENFDLLEKYKVEDWHGGKVQFIKPHVIHLMRGQIYEIEGKTFFTFGGGISIDKAYRIEHVSWWSQEEPSYQECNEALENLKKHGNEVDYILTHACPRSVMRNELNAVKRMINADCACEKFLDEVFFNVKYKYWFFGHYHLDARFKAINMECLYQNIIKLSDGMPIASRY